MDDEKLDRLLKKSPRLPADADAKDRALAAAMQAFDKKHEKNIQGFPLMLRLKAWTQQLREIHMNRSTALMTSACAVALIIGYSAFTTMQPDLMREQQEALTMSDPAVAPPPPPPTEALASTDSIEQASSIHAKRAESPQKLAAALPPSAPSGALMAERDMAAPTVAGNAASYEGIAVESAMPIDVYPQPYMEQGSDKFEETKTNPVKLTREEPVSTFSIDVDTASYAFVRSQLNYGQLPQKDAVRVEEMVNYFDYDYALPEKGEGPFKPSVTVTPSPWNKESKLIHIGIKGEQIAPKTAPAANLVFLVDTSGSMMEEDKLPLLKNALTLLVDNLRPTDTISIVTYAGSAGTALEPTQVKDKAKIIAALSQLEAGGSTAGAAGIEQAYTLAQKNFDKEGVNRVILATDGDFNVGITDPDQLENYIEKKRDSGVFLSILGFGEGNYNDLLMQRLAQNGNGNAAYIDTLNEARKVLVDEATSTLYPIAKDVKIQVEFNPALVAEYRLVGYETRMLRREDFNNDKIDAGEIGSGHAVTAIYEITPVGSSTHAVDPLRYGKEKKEDALPSTANKDEYGFLKIRYKKPDGTKSILMTTPITTKNDVALEQAPESTRFAVAVAGFGQLLRGDSEVGGATYADVLKLAEGAKGKDSFGYRAEFINLVKLAKAKNPTE